MVSLIPRRMIAAVYIIFIFCCLWYLEGSYGHLDPGDGYTSLGTWKGHLTVNMWHKLYCVEYILNKMHDSMTGLGYNLEESIVMK